MIPGAQDSQGEILQFLMKLLGAGSMPGSNAGVAASPERNPAWLNDIREGRTQISRPGGISTMESISFSGDGKHFVAPRIRVIDGRPIELSPDAAFAMAREKKDAIPFNSQQEADAWDQQFHEQEYQRTGEGASAGNRWNPSASNPETQGGMMEFLMNLLGGGKPLPLNQGGGGMGQGPGVPFMGAENLSPLSLAPSAGARPAPQAPMSGFKSLGMRSLPGPKKMPYSAPTPRGMMVNDPELDAIMASVGGAKLL